MYIFSFSARENQDKDETFTCQALEDPSGSMGDFKWFLDGVEQENSQEPTTTSIDDEIVYENEYKYKPKLADDKKKLQCQYFPSNGADHVDGSAVLNIKKMILPESPFIAENNVKVGEEAVVSMELELYPESVKSEVKWVIEDQNTGSKSEMYPGKTILRTDYYFWLAMAYWIVDMCQSFDTRLKMFLCFFWHFYSADA